MNIIITGGGGFLGQKLAKALVDSDHSFDSLILADIVEPAIPVSDTRIKPVCCDLSESAEIEKLITKDTSAVFHLAAIVSSHAEDDFDLGLKINLDTTRNLLERCRQTNPSIRFVFASSLAVFGGELPDVITDTTLLAPQSSYGTQKAMGELLVNDYARKGYVDARTLRLPTIAIRPGKPNKAASSFVSGIIREPLNNEPSVCPVSPDLKLWLSSPDTIIHNLIHLSSLPKEVFRYWRTINAPGISVTVEKMLACLAETAGTATKSLVTFTKNESVNRIVSSWPSAFDNEWALSLGFRVDADFAAIINQYITSEMQGAV